MRNFALLLLIIFFSTLGTVYGQEVAEQTETREMNKEAVTDSLLSETQEINQQVTDSLALEPAKPLSKDEQKIAEWEAMAEKSKAEADTLSEKAKSSPDPEAYHEVTKASLRAKKYQDKANQIKLKLRIAEQAEILKQKKAEKKAEKKKKDSE